MDELFSKLYGCEAAGRIANSMGDVTETLSFDEIRTRFGFVDTLMAQHKPAKTRPLDSDLEPWQGFHEHDRPAGMGEDGQERHKLTTLAILEKNGRITVTDLARTWIRHIDESKFGYLLGTQDKPIWMALKAGVKPWETGRHAHWPGFIGTAKAIVPVGMINACNPRQAALDAYDVARIKDTRSTSRNYAVDVAAALAAGTAEAFRASATVSSVIDASLDVLPPMARREVEVGQRWALEADDWTDLAPLYEEKYRNLPLPNAVEIMSRSLAVFRLSDGKVRESILWAVNLGRDTDCSAFFAASFAGAMHGIDAVPKEWLTTIEEVVKTDPYTVSTLTAREVAEGMRQAVLAERERARAVLGELDQLGDRSPVDAVR